jgi:hypothetical protein
MQLVTVVPITQRNFRSCLYSIVLGRVRVWWACADVAELSILLLRTAFPHFLVRCSPVTCTPRALRMNNDWGWLSSVVMGADALVLRAARRETGKVYKPGRLRRQRPTWQVF